MELCLVVAEKAIGDVLSTIDLYSPLVHSFEIRADYLDEEAYDRIGEIRGKTDRRLILTVRKRQDGGRWTGSEKLRGELYERALEAAFDYIDLEIDALPGVKGNGATTVIRSYHDMERVPPDILEKYVMAQTDPDEIPKIAVTLKSPADVLRFLGWNRLVRGMGSRKKIITAMGPKGEFSRILGKRLGTMHTYVSAPGKAPLPGMIDVRQLVHRYRVHEIDADTRVHGLLDGRSSFIPPDAADYRRRVRDPRNTVRVPFILDSLEEMTGIRDFFGVRRFYHTA